MRDNYTNKELSITVSAGIKLLTCTDIPIDDCENAPEPIPWQGTPASFAVLMSFPWQQPAIGNPCCELNLVLAL